MPVGCMSFYIEGLYLDIYPQNLLILHFTHLYLNGADSSTQHYQESPFTPYWFQKATCLSPFPKSLPQVPKCHLQKITLNSVAVQGSFKQ